MSRRDLWRWGVYALVLTLALAAVAGMVQFWGAAGIGAGVRRGLPALPAALAVHAVQLAISGLGWWCLLGRPGLRVITVMRARWIREALNTLLPFAGISGGVASGRLLAREGGLSLAGATAAVTGDLTSEAVAQAPYLIAALVTVAVVAPGALTPGRAALAVLPVAAAALLFVLAQRAGLMRLIELAANRLGFGTAMAGLHDGLMALHANPAQIARAVSLHLLSWSLGGAEVWVILRAMGHPLGGAACFALEGLGMAARSIGFALPAGLAAQEAGFVLAGAMLGVAAPDAVALSLVKRLRELAVGAGGVLTWQLRR